MAKKSVLRARLDEFRTQFPSKVGPCFCRLAKTGAQKEILEIINEMFYEGYGRILIAKMVAETVDEHGLRIGEKAIDKHMKQCLGGKRKWEN